MKLLLPPPPDRTADQLRNHFEVERTIAARLKAADREERARIYRTMYDELFEKVPDHPRLARRDDRRRSEALSATRLGLYERFLNESMVVAEFGSGDCRFAHQLCRRVGFVYGVDISDQRGEHAAAPENFQLILFDGYRLPLDQASVDLVLSEQLVEHLHPDDATLHFTTVRNVLRENGAYVFRTPHRFTGPHDVSKYFCDQPEGFHLKEWTYAELIRVLSELGYRRCEAYWPFRSRAIRAPVWCFRIVESLLKRVPRPIRRWAARYLLREIFLAARK